MFRLLAGGVLGATAMSYAFSRKAEVPEADGPVYPHLARIPYEHHPNQHFITKIPHSIGIVGGGGAGLVTAKVLSLQGFSVEVLEQQPRAGGLRSKHESESLQDRDMPDFKYPRISSNPPKLAHWQTMIDNFMKKFELEEKVVVNAKVEGIRQNEDGSWTARLQSGAEKHYDFLVLSTGLYDQELTPTWPGLDTFQGQAMHSERFKNVLSICDKKKVVVVGESSEAFEALARVPESAAQVTSVIRKQRWPVPANFPIFRRYARTLIKSRIGEMLSLSPETQSNWDYSILQPIADFFWRRLSTELRKALPAELVPAADLTPLQSHSVTEIDSEVLEKITNGEIQVIEGDVAKVVPEGIVVGDKVIPADVLVYASGFQENTFGLGRDGHLWLYRGVLHPDLQNFAVVGMQSVAMPEVRNNLQAMWLADVLRGNVELPSREEMQQAVDRRRTARLAVYDSWTAAYAQSPFSYYDELLSDMHLHTRRQCFNLTERPTALVYQTAVTHHV